MVQLSHPYMTTGKTIALTVWTFVSKVLSVLFNTLSRFVIAFLSGGNVFQFSPRWWIPGALGTGQVPGRMGAQGHGWAAHRPAGGSDLTWRSQKGLAFGVKALTAPPLC